MCLGWEGRMNHQEKKPEILSPAKDLDVLKCAVRYGADAVYIGGKSFGLRSHARNFTEEEMREGIEYAHAHGVRVYVAVNILAHESDYEKAESYFKTLNQLKPDAVLMADPGLIELMKNCCPDMEIHISTQANCLNTGAFLYWYKMGAKRVVCARELSLEEIRTIREKTPKDLEIEAFVHGAMCISYSGRCLLSSYFTLKDANRGFCTQPCRWKYALVEKTRPGEYFPIKEDERGTAILSSKDLCMIDHIPDLCRAGINSFKIEGRMKNALYVSTVTRAYRMAVDAWYQDEKQYYDNLPWYNEELRKCTWRPFTTGYYYGKPDEKSVVYSARPYVRGALWLGIVQSVRERDGAVRVEQCNKFSVGDRIEIMKPDGRNVLSQVLRITSEGGKEMQDAPHPQQILYVTLSVPCEQGDILRMLAKDSSKNEV